jgi:hypothetical protein
MRRFLQPNGRSILACGLAAVAVFAWAMPAQAQGTGTRGGGGTTSFGGGSGGGSSFGGGSGGGSSFGGGGSSFGGGGSFGGVSSSFSGGGTTFSGGGTTFSGGGTTFSGGGTNFSGGGTTFSGGGGGGGTNYTGGANRGGTFQGGAGGRGSTSSTYTYPGVATSNPFASYFANPMAAGLSGTNGRAASFGASVYSGNAYGLATTTTTGTSTQGGTTGLNGGYGGTNSNRYGSSSGGVYVPPLGAVVAYSGQQGSAPPVAVGTAALRPDLRTILVNTSRLSQPTRNALQVRMDGSTVVLQGEALDAHEAQVAEAMLRMSAGVSDVRNEMQIRGAAPPGP